MGRLPAGTRVRVLGQEVMGPYGARRLRLCVEATIGNVVVVGWVSQTTSTRVRLSP